MRPVLVLGGTSEGRAVASALVTAGQQVISSLAGRVANPRLPDGEVRIGGFGGVDGLVHFLRTRDISAIVDATHPFATGMTANATAAAAKTGVPLVILQRPAWSPIGSDHWTSVRDLASAAAELSRRPSETAVLLTTGRQGIGVFAPLPQRFWARMVDSPNSNDLPARCELILDRGPYTLEKERNLLRENAIEIVLTKNSGGELTSAKLVAARELGVEVLILERPGLPAGVDVVPGVAAAVTWVTSRSGPE